MAAAPPIRENLLTLDSHLAASEGLPEGLTGVISGGLVSATVWMSRLKPASLAALAVAADRFPARSTRNPSAPMRILSVTSVDSNIPSVTTNESRITPLVPRKPIAP